MKQICQIKKYQNSKEFHFSDSSLHKIRLNPGKMRFNTCEVKLNQTSENSKIQFSKSQIYDLSEFPNVQFNLA